MHQRTAVLEAQLTELRTCRDNLLQKFTAMLPKSDEDEPEAAIRAARSVIKEHIRLLHEYNEIRDIGQGLMGIIAESRGVRIKEVYQEFGIATKD